MKNESSPEQDLGRTDRESSEALPPAGRHRSDLDPAMKHLRERAAYLLEGAPAPMSSVLLAREILGIVGGSDAACEALLAPVLTGDPRFLHSGPGAWRLSETAPAYAAPAPPRNWIWAVWSCVPGARAAAVVRLEGGHAVEERFEAAPGMDLSVSHNPEALDSPSLERLAATGRGAIWATTDPSAVFSSLRLRLRNIDREGPEPTILVLARLVVAALGSPRPRSLAEVASRLGHRAVESDHPLRRARCAAECLLLLLDLPALSGICDVAGLEARMRPSPVAPSLEGRDFDADDLLDLPSAPGIYRFHDRDGNLLYVGKARNLRARVGSYFAARSVPDPRTQAWLSSVHRIEIEGSGSELEALLREADLITRSRPLRNLQRTVHDRTGAPSGHLVLLLPAPQGRMIRVHLIEAGHLVARVLLGPRSAGRKRLRSLLETIYFTAPARALAARRTRAEDALIASWMKGQAGVVPAFDPTDAAGPDEALELALRYAETLRHGEWDVVHR